MQYTMESKSLVCACLNKPVVYAMNVLVFKFWTSSLYVFQNRKDFIEQLQLLQVAIFQGAKS